MRGDNEIVAIMMEKLRKGNVLTIACGKGRLVIDPSTGDISRSPSAALLACMSDEERQRTTFWDATDEDYAFGIDPFADARQAREGGDGITGGDAELANMLGLLVTHLGLDAGVAMTVRLTEHLLRLASYVPGMTLVDMGALIESPDGIRAGMSFVPDEDGEKPHMEAWLLDKLPRHTDCMKRCLSALWDVPGIRHMLGQSDPRGLGPCLTHGGIMLARVPNDQLMAPFCQELLLRASNLTDDPIVNWAYRPVVEIVNALPSDSAEVHSVIDRMRIRTAHAGRVGRRDATDRQIRQRAKLIAAGDRDGWMGLCGGCR